MTSDDYILDDATVRDFIATVRERIERAGSPEEACEAIRPAFGELLADGEWLPAEYRREAPESGMGGGIGRWLLYRSGERSLSLFTLVVPPGTATPVHDHLAWGLGGLYPASRTKRSTRAATRGLELVQQRALGHGDFYVLIPRAPTSTASTPPRRSPPSRSKE